MAEDFAYLDGIYNITPTPFAPDGSLDTASLTRLTEALVACGIQGLTVLGVLGEYERVTESERDRVIAGAVEAAAGRISICAGTSHAGTDVCVAYSRRAQELGAQSVMVAPPKLSRSDEAALRRHYLAVAEAIDIPIVVQDHPPSSGVHMSVDFLARLADEAPRCRFLKAEDEPTAVKMRQVRAANPHVRMFGGQGGIMFFEELRQGAIGTMTGFAFPEILVEILQSFRAGNVDAAARLFYHYLPLIRFENQARINLPLRKEIYRMRGFITSARARAPFMPVDEGTLEDLRYLLTTLDIPLAAASRGTASRGTASQGTGPRGTAATPA